MADVVPPGTLEILDGWGLLANPTALDRLSMGDLHTIGKAIDRHYAAAVTADIGGCHIGLSDSIRIGEGRASLSQLAFPLVTHDHIWLSDPICSFLSLEASSLWRQTPEGGGKLFGDSKTIVMHWRSLWNFPKEGRRNYARKVLPGLVQVLRELKPLIVNRLVRLFAWERVAYAQLAVMRDTVLELESNPIMMATHRSVPQGEFTLGPRAGQMSIIADTDSSDGTVKKGDQLWVVDTKPMLLTAVANLEVSAATGASYQPTRRGDRLLVEFIAGGATAVPRIEKGWPIEAIPNLSKALWPDIRAIRADSQTLQDFRTVLEAAESFEGEPSQLVKALGERFEQVGTRLREDVSLGRATKNAMTNMSIDTVATSSAAGLAALLSGAGLHVSAGAAIAVAPLKVLLNRFLDPTRKAKVKRANLFIRVGERL
jgi:hypothetical protein